MMSRVGAAIMGAIVCAVCGCASHPAASVPGPATREYPATTQALDEKSLLTLDKIAPVPTLSKPKPHSTTAPTPLDALEDFAKARAALASGQRQVAINLLEKAVAIDPDSPELYQELGIAYGSQDKAVWAFEKAIELDPDNLDLHERLGRHFLIKNKLDESLLHFRLAAQTAEYTEDEESSAVIDFFLARVLQRKGYDRAALDSYARLAKRLERPIPLRGGNTELLTLQSQPELTYAQMAELYEKFGQYADAVKAYEVAANRAPENFEIQARLARALVEAGRGADAQTQAVALVTRFKASNESLKVLREIYKVQGREGEVVAALSKLNKEKPGDRSILFALADALKNANRASEAEALLLEAAKKSFDGSDMVRRVFDMYEERGDTEGAVRLLVNALADNPDSLRQLSPMWADLLKPSRRQQLRLPLLQKLKVEPRAEASRLFWVSRVADLWDRDALARSALEQGGQIKPAFAPIYRALVGDYWSRPDWDDAQKAAASDLLAKTARDQGNAALAAELEGLSLLRQNGKAAEAAARLDESIKLGNKAPDVMLTQARAVRAQGNSARAENLLWRVISDNPTYEDAYTDLFREYFNDGQAARAINVLGKWLAADPGNVHARVLRARLMQSAGRNESAESELLSLFKDQPDSAEILSAMYDFFVDARRVDEFIGRLEEQRKLNPGNREAAEQLVMIYNEQKRLPEALRVLEASRKAVAGDADLMYYIAHVYGRIGQKQTEEQMLEEVVKLDPRHAPASNDLGYTWADEGRNMARAEELVRVAVETEPDNQSFLDSMGWVLYKRSKFADARVFFERAIGPATRPDPVVLDHMGDVLYRLSQVEGAVKQWKRALQRLDEVPVTREDLKKLRLLLMQKLRQRDQGQPVEVAPVAETAPAQAKN